MKDLLFPALARLVLAPVLAFCYLLRALGLGVLGVAGRGLGAALYHLRFRRQIVGSNLRLAFRHELSEAQMESLCRSIYRSIGCTFLEIARNFALTKAGMRRELLLSDAARKQIEAALGRGKGIVFISAHIANWELLAMGMAAHCFPVAVVVKRMSSRLSQFLIERQRSRSGLEILYAGRTIEQMKVALSAGKVIGFMVDQNTTGRKGIRVNFFGVPAASIRGLAGLIRDTGAAVIPICAFRLPDGRHKVEILPELPYLAAEASFQGAEERALREEWLNTQSYQAAIESLIRIHPEQWLWIHRRWKASRSALSFDTAHLEG